MSMDETGSVANVRAWVRWRMRVVAALVGTATLIGGCGEGAFDVSPDAVYVLERVNGLPLPALIGVSQFAVHRLEADTIRFIGERRFEVTRWTSFHEIGSDEVVIERAVWNGRLVPVRGGFTMESDVCRDPTSLALCIAPDTASVDDGDLVLRGSVPPVGMKRYAKR